MANNPEKLKLPKGTYWIIVHKGDDLYALDAPCSQLKDRLAKKGKIKFHNYKLTRIMDDKPIVAILNFLRDLDEWKS